jgi:hypothetical protein
MSDPAHLDDLAHACVAAVQRSLGIELDFTQDTLPILDHYISMAQGSKAEVIELLAPMAGAYFGEVVRRGVGAARWHAPTTDYHQYRLEFESAFLHFNPLGMVVESVMKAPVEGWMAHLQMLPKDREPVLASLEALGGVRDIDYYRLSVRFEAVEQVYLVLCHLALSAAEDQPYFSHEVYEATLSTGVLPSDGQLH